MPGPHDSDFDVFTVDQLNKIQQTYKAQGNRVGYDRVENALRWKMANGVPQTEALANSGRLYPHKFQGDETGRVCTKFTGDISEFMKPFTAGPAVCKSNCYSEVTARARAAEQSALIADGLAARAARSK